MRNQNNPMIPIHLFLTGSIGIRKTFVTKGIYHGLLQFYNKDLHSNPLNKKGIIVAFIRRVLHNIDDITMH